MENVHLQLVDVVCLVVEKREGRRGECVHPALHIQEPLSITYMHVLICAGGHREKDVRWLLFRLPFWLAR
jgi:hypothetical protein